MFYEHMEDEAVRCNLCAHNCVIHNSKRGICDVRENQDGRLYSLVYGKMASLVPDPIEKKPLYHFHPGTQVLSYGTMGCNFKCLFCQNASLSCGDPKSAYLREITVEEVVKATRRYDGIAWTYNEPTVGYEFSYDVFRRYKEKDLGYTAYVTNGYMEKEPLEKIAPYLDAMNIDVKAFSDEFYDKIVGGKLQPVLDTAERAIELGIHVEITYLIIPTHNDENDEIGDLCSWVCKELGEDTPVHYSRFHPDHNMRDVPATPTDKMMEAKKIADEFGLNYVYLGNIHSDNDTYCPSCGFDVLSRGYFSSSRSKLKNGGCPRCGKKIPIIL